MCTLMMHCVWRPLADYKRPMSASSSVLVIDDDAVAGKAHNNCMINQSLSRWCLHHPKVETMARVAHNLPCRVVDLLIYCDSTRSRRFLRIAVYIKKHLVYWYCSTTWRNAIISLSGVLCLFPSLCHYHRPSSLVWFRLCISPPLYRLFLWLYDLYFVEI